MVNTNKPRLPKGVVQKLSDNVGGGRHTKKKGKGSYTRNVKHPKRNSREMNADSFLSLFEVVIEIALSNREFPECTFCRHVDACTQYPPSSPNSGVMLLDGGPIQLKDP